MVIFSYVQLVLQLFVNLQNIRVLIYAGALHCLDQGSGRKWVTSIQLLLLKKKKRIIQRKQGTTHVLSRVKDEIFINFSCEGKSLCDAIQHLIHHRLSKVDLFKEAGRQHKKLDIRLQTTSTSYPDRSWK